MPVANLETCEGSHATVADRVVDAARHAAHFSHEARLVKSMAEDAIEDGVHAAKRAMKRARRGVERLADLKDETALCVKRQPFRAVGTALGAGLVIGAVAGWIGAQLRQRQPGNT